MQLTEEVGVLRSKVDDDADYAGDDDTASGYE